MVIIVQIVIEATLNCFCSGSFTDVVRLSVYCGWKMNWAAASQVAFCRRFHLFQRNSLFFRKNIPQFALLNGPHTNNSTSGACLHICSKKVCMGKNLNGCNFSIHSMYNWKVVTDLTKGFVLEYSRPVARIF